MGDVARHLHEPEDPLPAVGEADARGARGAGPDGFHAGEEEDWFAAGVGEFGPERQATRSPVARAPGFHGSWRAEA